MLVSGRHDAFQPTRQNEGISAEVQWQDRQFASVDGLQSVPELAALLSIQFDFDGFQNIIDAVGVDVSL